MNLNRILGAGLLIATLTLVSFKIDKDPLHKRKFKAQVTEIKDGKPKNGKPIEDEIEFKNGKVYSTVCWDKMEFQDIKYEITKDSTYTDEGEEKRYYEIVASTANEKKETLTMNFTIDGYSIEGTYKLTKKDVIKKMFTTIGTEKVKNPKKEKEKKE
jgi:hypothetical protein